MSPYPVTIRLLDPPFHEFLPFEHELVEQLAELKRLRDSAQSTGKLLEILKLIDGDLYARYAEGQGVFPAVLDGQAIEQAIAKRALMLDRARSLRETNPMLGHRGVRLGISYPEIYTMQIQAILEAAAECIKEGIEVHPEIMVPQVACDTELKWVKGYVDKVQAEVEAAHGVKLDFKYGTMVEVVRAAVTADDMAAVAEFFSFGTNDLTQATFSFSREDAENKFLPFYQQIGIVPANPFESLDVTGVGSLMKIGVDLGRKTRPDLKVGICGEHGGHPASIRLCHRVGLNYVSCSGPRVPIARLAAAHATMTEKGYDV